MTLHELDSASSVNSFKSSNANTLICFSATWCGPCKASKPQLQDMASLYDQDSTKDVKCGIAYEHNLAEAIHEFQIKAFPTYVLYVNNGAKEAGRIEGVNFQGIKMMIEKAGCKQDMGDGHSLGTGAGNAVLSAAEARAQRIAMFEKKAAATSTTAASTDDDNKMDIDNDTTANENTPMETEPVAVSVEKENTTQNKSEDKQGNVDEVKDDTTMDETTTSTEETEMVDPTLSLPKEHIETLTGAMGFTLLRAQKGLLNGSNSVKGAVEWLMAHQDDDDIDDPIPLVPKHNAAAGATVQSYKCNECGKILSNMANLELHANKTGHSDFEESTQAAKQLTEEEKAAKILEIKSLLKAKRAEREEVEKVDDVEREKQRRSMGQQMIKTKQEMERQATLRHAQKLKKEKESFKRERARIRAELEKDKAERRAHKGKLTSRLGIDGYNPDAIQYDVDAEGDNEGQVQATPVKKKSKASVAKIDEYISKVSGYKAAGDGGKCLKILLAYIKNVVDNPNEEKFKTVNMENKVFKTKVKPFIGAKSLLLAVGFSPNVGGTALVLAEHADREVLTLAKDKIAAAYAAY